MPLNWAAHQIGVVVGDGAVGKASVLEIHSLSYEETDGVRCDGCRRVFLSHIPPMPSPYVTSLPSLSPWLMTAVATGRIHPYRYAEPSTRFSDTELRVHQYSIITLRT